MLIAAGTRYPPYGARWPLEVQYTYGQYTYGQYAYSIQYLRIIHIRFLYSGALSILHNPTLQSVQYYTMYCTVQYIRTLPTPRSARRFPVSRPPDPSTPVLPSLCTCPPAACQCLSPLLACFLSPHPRISFTTTIPQLLLWKTVENIRFALHSLFIHSSFTPHSLSPPADAIYNYSRRSSTNRPSRIHRLHAPLFVCPALWSLGRGPISALSQLLLSATQRTSCTPTQRPIVRPSTNLNPTLRHPSPRSQIFSASIVASNLLSLPLPACQLSVFSSLVARGLGNGRELTYHFI